MSAAMISSRATSSAIRPSVCRTSARRCVVVRSAEDDKKFSLDSSRQAAVGFTEKDSAGQTNIFPSVMGAYEVGSAADTAADGTANTLYAVGALAVAGALVAIGVLGGLGSGGAPAVDVASELAQFGTISSYAAKFASQL